MTKVRRKKTVRKKPVNSRKVTLDGITFDSILESKMYIALKKAKIKFSYIGQENSKYTVLDPSTYKNECYERAQKRSKAMRDTSKIAKAGYTPDFSGEKEEWFIEVKGRKIGDFSLKWKMFKNRLNNRVVVPLLFMPTTIADINQVIEILIKKGYGTK